MFIFWAKKKDTHHFRQEKWASLYLIFQLDLPEKKQNTHKFINKRSGCPFFLCSFFSLVDANHFAVACFVQSEYQFRTKSQQAVFVGDDQTFALAGLESVASSADWRYKVVDLRQCAQVRAFHKPSSEAQWKERHLNGRRPERWSNDYSQQNPLNLNKFKQL